MTSASRSKGEDDMPWIVGREGVSYVENAEPFTIAGIDCGEQPFATEAEALQFAIDCDADIRRDLTRNIKELRARLRRLQRAHLTDQEGQNR